jgi:6-pyruvoyltetrahydropterin/6-carboxytetrahydropterin synthase
MKVQYITRKGTFDSGHRVMNERMKCFNVHGHTYLYELEFEFHEMEDIGYAIDFKEIKRVGCQWIDDILDHGMILNPKDIDLIETTKKLGSKLWLMSLNGAGEYCNPSAENIAKEIFLAMEVLFKSYNNLNIHKITLYETPNCYTTCIKDSISTKEWNSWNLERRWEIEEYAKEKGIVEYDDRKI